jgi:hypothetical protein
VARDGRRAAGRAVQHPGDGVPSTWPGPGWKRRGGRSPPCATRKFPAGSGWRRWLLSWSATWVCRAVPGRGRRRAARAGARGAADPLPGRPGGADQHPQARPPTAGRAVPRLRAARNPPHHRGFRRPRQPRRRRRGRSRRRLPRRRRPRRGLRQWRRRRGGPRGGRGRVRAHRHARARRAAGRSLAAAPTGSGFRVELWVPS